MQKGVNTKLVIAISIVACLLASASIVAYLINREVGNTFNNIKVAAIGDGLVCKRIDLDDVEKDAKKSVTDSINATGFKFIEYGSKNYIVISGGANIKKQIDISILKNYDSAEIGYLYSDGDGDYYAIIETNLSKDKVKVKEGLWDVGISNKEFECIVTSVNKKDRTAVIFNEMLGTKTIAFTKKVNIKEGLYRVTIDSNEQIKKVKKLGVISLRASIQNVEGSYMTISSHENSIKLKAKLGSEENIEINQEKVFTIEENDGIMILR